MSRRNDLPPVTAADLSPSGEHLAVLAHNAVWLFERPGDDDWLAGRSSRLHLDRRTGRRLEAITWLDDRTLILAGEDRRMFEVATSAFEALH